MPGFLQGDGTYSTTKALAFPFLHADSLEAPHLALALGIGPNTAIHDLFLLAQTLQSGKLLSPPLLKRATS